MIPSVLCVKAPEVLVHENIVGCEPGSWDVAWADAKDIGELAWSKEELGFEEPCVRDGGKVP